MNIFDYFRSKKALINEKNSALARLKEKQKEVIYLLWCQSLSKTQKIIKMRDAMQWMSGSGDFAPGGKARKGFEKIVLPLLLYIK